MFTKIKDFIWKTAINTAQVIKETSDDFLAMMIIGVVFLIILSPIL